MIIYQPKIKLGDVSRRFVNNPNQQTQPAHRVVRECSPNLGSDGSFLGLDSDGEVKLFEVGEHNNSPSQVINPLIPLQAIEEVTSHTAPDTETTVGSYQRPDITLYDRLQIATCFWDPARPWGTVAWLARKYGTSRQTIYQIATRAQRGLSAGKPGPKSIPQQTQTCSITALTAQSKVVSANAQKDHVRERIILTSVFPGAVTMRPLEEVLKQIPGINSCSDTTIWRVINEAGQRADQILSEVDYQQVKLPLVFVAIDETFFNGYPIFFVVEPISLAICAYYIPPDKDRSADNWYCVLELLKKEQNLNIIGGLGDAAKAYFKIIKYLLRNN